MEGTKKWMKLVEGRKREREREGGRALHLDWNYSYTSILYSYVHLLHLQLPPLIFYPSIFLIIIIIIIIIIESAGRGSRISHSLPLLYLLDYTTAAAAVRNPRNSSSMPIELDLSFTQKLSFNPTSISRHGISLP